MKRLTGATINILQKQKVCYLLLGKNITSPRFTLILVLKTDRLNKFMSTGTLVLLLMMNLAGDHLLLTHVKPFQFLLLLLLLLSQPRHFVGTPERTLFYYAHISPHLTYASTVWDGCSDMLFNKLNSLHRRAAKLMISDSSLTTDTTKRYSGLCRLKEKLNLAPPYLKRLFICSNTRATFRFITLPKPRIDLFKTTFSFSGVSLWNTIPSQIKSCNSLISYKTQLHEWFRSSLL